MKKAAIPLFLIISLAGNVQAQTLHTIDSLGNVKKYCLDSGIAMHHCVTVSAEQMDSLLTLTYQKLYRRGSNAQKAALAKDQANRVKKKDSMLSAQKAEKAEKIKKDEWDKIEGLMMFEDAVAFLETRVRYLVKKLNSR